MTNPGISAAQSPGTQARAEAGAEEAGGGDASAVDDAVLGDSAFDDETAPAAPPAVDALGGELHADTVSATTPRKVIAVTSRVNPIFAATCSVKICIGTR